MSASVMGVELSPRGARTSRATGSRAAATAADGTTSATNGLEAKLWQSAGTSSYLTRQDVAVPGRWEFIGRVAPEAVRSRYVGRSVKAYLQLGFQSPVRYVNC